ncbi:hypothetical protein CEXT_388151 [Caerostris extrusa]|uniref:Uncharacterized protein n=1 Tax=Caerostris extrusa TaxID=172846 RepID=A0AAV4VKJ0_CAEEX|nr:hypothetical protein CEXT_388151 [Caerostris extrusa]
MCANNAITFLNPLVSPPSHLCNSIDPITLLSLSTNESSPCLTWACKVGFPLAEGGGACNLDTYSFCFIVSRHINIPVAFPVTHFLNRLPLLTVLLSVLYHRFSSLARVHCWVVSFTVGCFWLRGIDDDDE